MLVRCLLAFMET